MRLHTDGPRTTRQLLRGWAIFALAVIAWAGTAWLFAQWLA